MSFAALLPILLKIAEWAFNRSLIKQKQYKSFLEWSEQALKGPGTAVEVHDDIERQLKELRETPDPKNK